MEFTFTTKHLKTPSTNSFFAWKDTNIILQETAQQGTVFCN